MDLTSDDSNVVTSDPQTNMSSLMKIIERENLLKYCKIGKVNEYDAEQSFSIFFLNPTNPATTIDNFVLTVNFPSNSRGILCTSQYVDWFFSDDLYDDEYHFTFETFIEQLNMGIKYIFSRYATTSLCSEFGSFSI